MRDEVVETVRQYIIDTYLPGEDPRALGPSTELISSGILDSLATLDLVSYLEGRFNIELDAHEVDTASLGTLDRIAQLVETKLDAG
ncbi:MAG TPA: phosphopantetheine-binding protein [Longimicrobiales bacterium]|nr:phosphopantetheine-binding protein [Longimicrobiales bacterium]